MALQPSTTDAIIRVRDITVQFGKTRVLDGLNLDVRRGEILGFAGLIGAGRTEVARALFGADPLRSGDIRLKGARIQPRSPRQTVEAGMALVPEAVSYTHLTLPTNREV